MLAQLKSACYINCVYRHIKTWFTFDGYGKAIRPRNDIRHTLFLTVKKEKEVLMSSEDVATDVAEHLSEQQPVEQVKTHTQADVDRAVQARLARERASMGGMQAQPQAQPGFDKDALLQEAAQMMQKQMDEQQAAHKRDLETAEVNKIAETYMEKMAQGKELYDDFEEVTQDFSPAAYPQVTIMASQYDNLPDIMYELGKNPRKLVDLHVMALSNPPQAKKQMAALSASIKQNEQALASNQKSPTPLSRMKASKAAGQDTGRRTISDMRKDPRYRG